MARYNITNTTTGQVMFGGDYPSFAACVQDAANKGVPLWGANLANQDLTGVNFIDGQLQGVNLSGSTLSGDNFTQADLTGANLTNANATTAIFNDTNVLNATTTGILESINLNTAVPD